jgi:transcriptional regulator with XRE-family HTH domain
MFQSRELTPDQSGRHFFGAEVRRCREAAGMSLSRLAGIVSSSKTVLSDVERAECTVPPALPGELDMALDTGGYLERIYGLIKYEVHPDQYREYMGLESRALELREYAVQTIPGLLQTPAYAEALTRACNPEANEREIDTLVTARLDRQSRMQGPGALHFWAVLDEAAIRRPIGDRLIMCEQLKALVPRVDSPRCTLQVLPFAAGAHPALGGPVVLLRMPDDTTVAYLEGHDTGTLVVDSEEVAKRRRSYDRVVANALSPEQSATLILKAIEEHQREHERERRDLA